MNLDHPHRGEDVRLHGFVGPEIDRQTGRDARDGLRRPARERAITNAGCDEENAPIGLHRHPLA